jgi:hypothetical protein
VLESAQKVSRQEPAFGGKRSKARQSQPEGRLLKENVS